MHRYSLLKLLHLRSRTPDGIVAIYVNSSLRTLAISLVGVFFPVFVFLRTQDVYGENIIKGLYGVIVYYFIVWLIVLATTLPAAKFLAKWGFRRTVFISNLFLILMFILFTLASRFFWILPLAAVVQGIMTPLYWLAYHTLFAQDGVLSHLGEEMGVVMLSRRMAAIAGPAVGGLIITIWGFPVLFSIALVVVIFSGIPFLFMHHHIQHFSVSWKGVQYWLKRADHRNEKVGIFGRFIDERMHVIFWPIFVYLVVGVFSHQGLVESLSLVFGSISVYLAGRYFDKVHSLKLFRMGVFGTVAAVLVRGFSRTFGQLILLNSVKTVLSPYYWLTFDSLVYERARRKGEMVLSFMVARELIISVATLFSLVLVAFIVPFAWRFWGIWLIASGGILASLVMWEKKK